MDWYSSKLVFGGSGFFSFLETQKRLVWHLWNTNLGKLNFLGTCSGEWVPSRFSHVPLFCDPMDCGPPGSSVHGILQARILEWGCHALLQRIFPTQRRNPHLMSSALASRFFTTSVTWEALQWGLKKKKSWSLEVGNWSKALNCWRC